MAATTHPPPAPAQRSEVPIVDPPKPPSSYLPDDASLPQPTQARADAIKEENAGGSETRGTPRTLVDRGPPVPPTPTQDEADALRGLVEGRRQELDYPAAKIEPTQEELDRISRDMKPGPAGTYQTR